MRRNLKVMLMVLAAILFLDSAVIVAQGFPDPFVAEFCTCESLFNYWIEEYGTYWGEWLQWLACIGHGIDVPGIVECIYGSML